MKEKSLVFTQEEFQDFMLKKMKEVFPELTFTIEELFSVSIEQKSQEKKALLNLTNAWNAYEVSGDLNEVLHYLEAMVATQHYLQDDASIFNYPQDKDVIYPSIRSIDYAKEAITHAQEENKSNLLTQPITEDLMFLYMLDYPQFVVAMTEDMLIRNIKNDKNISEEELKTTNGYTYLKELVIENAWENQKKRGWVKQAVKKKTAFGLFYHFYHPEFEYQAQFFIKEWTMKYIGPLFYITFPTKNSTLVLVPSGTTPQFQQLAKQLLLLDTGRIQQNERNYLTSSKVYQVHSEKGITLA